MTEKRFGDVFMNLRLFRNNVVKESAKTNQTFWIKVSHIIFLSVCVWGLLNIAGNRNFDISKYNFITRLNIGKRPLCKDCNILLISLDTLSANHLPCYGYERDTAPGLCKFAKQNIIFTNSYAQSYWTIPSHFSIFTSLYPSTHRMLDQYKDVLNPSYETLTEMLKKNDYHTSYFGTTTAATLPFDKGLERGFDSLNDQENFIPTDWDRAINYFIQNAKKNKSFTFIHTYYLHLPYFLANKSNLRYTDTYYPELNINRELVLTDDTLAKDFFTFVHDQIISKQILNLSQDKNIINIINLFSNAKTISEKRKYFQLLSYMDMKFDDDMLYTYFISLYAGKENYVESLYDEKIFDLDQIVSRSIERVLKEVPHNTIIIITSDHGEAFMEHGMFGHNDLYSEIQRVPLVLYVPGITNKQIDSLAQGIDLYPTILDIVGISYDKAKIEGKSIACLSQCTLQQIHPFIISEEYTDERSLVVVDPVWKIYAHNIDATQSAGKQIELFDVKKDPGDLNDIAAENKVIVSEKMKIMQSFINRPPLPISLSPLPIRTSESIEKERREKINYFHY